MAEISAAPPSSPAGGITLRMQGMVKRFPGVLALDHAWLEVSPGECHAVVGENGAGKSTLMRILSGAQAADEGSILFDGEAREIHSPLDAQALGVSMIHQELNLLPELSVAENIFLGHEITRGPLGWVDRPATHRRAAALLESLGQQIDPAAKVKRLSLAQQQMVEIAKSISIDARILIMDEPSAILTDQELMRLFALIRQLKARDYSVIYISHRMDEIFEVCDRVTVMRDGHTVNVHRVAEVTEDTLVREMVGRPMESFFAPPATEAGEEVLLVEGLCRAGKLRDCSLRLRAGEIVGLTGLVGAGRTELARAIFGADPIDSGSMTLGGKPFAPSAPRDAIDAGVALLTEDRKGQGLALHLNVRENVSLATLGELCRGGFIAQAEERALATRYVDELRVKTPSIEQRVKNLSGGNQQKVVLAKWLAADARLLIFDEPTRGIDVGAKSEIYHLIDGLARQGKAILLISSELPEVLNTCHRILVMRDGAIQGELSGDEATQEKILALAMGLEARIAHQAGRAPSATSNSTLPSEGTSPQ